MTTTQNTDPSTTTAEVVRIVTIDGPTTYAPLDHVAMDLAKSTDLSARYIVDTLRTDSPQVWGPARYEFVKAEVPTAAVEEIASQIVSEVMAQLDDLSDDTTDTIGRYEIDGDDVLAAALLAIAEDLRLTLQCTVDSRVDDWRADYGVA